MARVSRFLVPWLLPWNGLPRGSASWYLQDTDEVDTYDIPAGRRSLGCSGFPGGSLGTSVPAGTSDLRESREGAQIIAKAK